MWLCDGATSSAPEAIKAEILKLNYLRQLGADQLDLSSIPPERLRQLATLGRRCTPKALREMSRERRYPILLATLASSHTGAVGELVQMFDQALVSTDSRARNLVLERQAALVGANVDRLDLLDEILDLALDPGLDDRSVGRAVRGLGNDRLSGALRDKGQRPPKDGGHLELMEARFAHIRSFAPHVLGALSFQSTLAPSEVLSAVRLLQTMNSQDRRHVPDNAPVGFVPSRWRPYLDDARAAGNENAYKHYWELCVLFALRGAIRSGEIWIEGSRRYSNLASYLIPAQTWPDKRGEVLELIGMPATFSESLAGIEADYSRYLDELEALLADGSGPVLLDNGKLRLSPLAAERVDPELLVEKQGVIARLPTVPLAEAIIEVDKETSFSAQLTHAGGGTPRAPELEHRRNVYAALIAQACNFGSTRMSELTGIGADTLDWYTHWYLRDETTLRAANAAVVNLHHRHPLAERWGGGTLSSLDGLRLPMRGHSLMARALSRYFIDQGVTTYCHVSDQHSTYGTQIIVSTERDGLYVLDEILGNTTELPIVEHTTDTHGQMLATFALFDLVGKQLSPRIAKIADKPLWRPQSAGNYQRWPLAGPLLEQRAQIELIDSIGTSCSGSPARSNSDTYRPPCW